MQSNTLLYDTFNAKYLSYQEVVDSFISNNEFYQLQSNNSMLLMGPRGCGKTTLLKMLTPAGLYYWQGEEAERFKNTLQFTAVYIPSDIQWKTQLEYLNTHLRDEAKFNDSIAQFLFSTNIQIALCKTFNSIIGFANSTPQQKSQIEYNIIKGLLDVWKIEDANSATFDDLELSLLKRVNHINTIMNTAIVKRSSDFKIIDKLPEYVFSDFFDLVKLGCKVFENKLNLGINYKWALCFDELEIAPKFLQLKLMKFLRSVDQKFVFKLTTTPIFNLEDTVIEASENNDFNAIKLWVYDENGLDTWVKFCHTLITNRLKNKFHINTDSSSSLETLFGNYSLDDIIKEELDALSFEVREQLGYKKRLKPGTGKESSVNFLFKYLAMTDKSFHKFLEDKEKDGINPEDPFTYNSFTAKSLFLKYKVDATYRLIYKNRGRKTPHIHFGLPYIFDICDGNPRHVIGLVDEIMLRSNFDILESKCISKEVQSKIIFEVSEKYFNLLQNHPDSTIIVRDATFNLASDLLKPIGNYMHAKIIQDEFSKTSPSTFKVDIDINYKLVGLLETALSLGAIVYLDPIESLSNSGIINKRFRLSSFLAPKFKVPNRILSEVQLSTILKIEQQKNQTKLDYTENDNT
jgi:energy-coupling factor transporter ATP-binding protein EcfA2